MNKPSLQRELCNGLKKQDALRNYISTSVELWTMLACVCTPPDTRLFPTTSGVGSTKIKTPSRRRITEGPSFASLPVPTTHLPSGRSPPATASVTAIASCPLVTTPLVTEDELATPDPKESEDNSAYVQVRCTVHVSSHCSVCSKCWSVAWNAMCALRTFPRTDIAKSISRECLTGKWRRPRAFDQKP
jgi:hypothetical protein